MLPPQMGFLTKRFNALIFKKYSRNEMLFQKCLTQKHSIENYLMAGVARKKLNTHLWAAVEAPVGTGAKLSVTAARNDRWRPCYGR